MAFFYWGNYWLNLTNNQVGNQNYWYMWHNFGELPWPPMAMLHHITMYVHHHVLLDDGVCKLTCVNTYVNYHLWNCQQNCGLHNQWPIWWNQIKRSLVLILDDKLIFYLTKSCHMYLWTNWLILDEITTIDLTNWHHIDWCFNEWISKVYLHVVADYFYHIK